MVKKCKIVLKNSAVVVVDFNGVNIQMPYSNDIKDYVYVRSERGRYSFSTKEEYELGNHKIITKNTGIVEHKTNLNSNQKRTTNKK